MTLSNSVFAALRVPHPFLDSLCVCETHSLSIGLLYSTGLMYVRHKRHTKMVSEPRNNGLGNKPCCSKQMVLESDNVGVYGVGMRKSAMLESGG